jgi:hypothetical protein
VRKLRRNSGPWRGVSVVASSLAPLILLSLLTAVFLTQSTATLAYPSFQSPVRTPAPTTEPPEGPVPPAEGSPVTPPQATPAAPPGEEPVVPPGEEPIAPPGEVVTPSGEPEGTPGEDGPAEPVTSTLSTGEEESSPAGGISWAVLIDTCVVGFSSVWLCCGGLALVVFGLLVVASFLLRVT